MPDNFGSECCGRFLNIVLVSVGMRSAEVEYNANRYRDNVLVAVGG